MAFAQPYIPSSNSGTGDENQAIAIYIDNSASMLGEGSNGPLLDEARLKAATILKSLPANSSVQLLNNSFEARQQRYNTPANALLLADETQLSYAQRDFKEVLERAQTLARDEQKENVSLIVLSDFQANAFDLEKLEVPENIDLKAIHLQTLDQNGNVAVDSIWLKNEALLNGVPQTLYVQLKNYAAAEQEISVDLLLDDQLYGSKKTVLQEDANTTLSFNFLPQNQEVYSGEIKLGASAPNFDNNFYFALNLSGKPKVVAIGLEEETNVLKGFYNADQYEFSAYSPKNLNIADIESANAVLIASGTTPSSGLLAALRELLENGGNLVLFPQETESSANEVLKTFNAGQLGNIQVEEKRAAALNWEDPFFDEAFLKRSDRPNLPLVQKHYATNSLNQRFTKLVSLPANQILLGRMPVLQGQLFISSVELSKSFSNLPEHKVLIPTLVNAARLSAGKNVLYNYHAQNRGQYFKSSNADKNPVTLKLEEGESIIPQQRAEHAKAEVYNLPSSIAPGIYSAYVSDSLVGKLALNHNPDESNWRFLSTKSLANTFEIWEAEEGNLKASINSSFVDDSFWQIALAIALLFFLLEIVLIKFLK
jgi:hypothetical protein